MSGQTRCRRGLHDRAGLRNARVKPQAGMLVAQANSESALLLTADSAIAQYEGPIRLFQPV